MGDHSAKTESAMGGEVSSYGSSVAFSVGDTDIARQSAANPGKSDVNGDGKVDLVDFSVLVYWYHRSNPPATMDLNGDGVVDLKDFSIMAFHWSG